MPKEFKPNAMAKTSINTLKAWAVRGWKPLASQINDWFDSFWHKDEPIPISGVDGLAQALNEISSMAGNPFAEYPLNADGYYEIPAGYLLEMVIPLLGADAPAFSIGSTNNGGELLPSAERLATDDTPVLVWAMARTGVRRIYFNGVPNNSSFILFIRKISL